MHGLSQIYFDLLEDTAQIVGKLLGVAVDQLGVYLYVVTDVDLRQGLFQFLAQGLGNICCILIPEVISALLLSSTHSMKSFDDDSHSLIEDLPAVEFLHSLSIGNGQVLGDQEKLYLVLKICKQVHNFLLLSFPLL